MAPIKTLRSGDRGPAVAFLQLALTRAQTDPGQPDGIFGNRTALAVTKFQAQNGLAPDGVAGPRTQEALMPFYTGFRRHTVARGDTFYRLARRYGTTASAIAAANPRLRSDRLQIGQRLVIPLGFDVVSGEIPITSEIAAYYITGLAARYPFLRTGSIGESVLGKPLQSLTIGNGAAEVFFNGAHHANEWITALLLLKFCEQYAAAAAFGSRIGDQDAAALMERTTLSVVPMVNPDGVDLVTGALTSKAAYDRAAAIAAEFPQIPFPEGWKANIVGIDPNLSYPAEWDRAREIKFAQGYTRPAPRDFVGSEPLEAVESRAVYDFTRARDFRLTLSYHTQGEVIFWQFLDKRPPRAEEIGRVLAEVSGYELAETPYESSFAGYKDWFLAQYNRPGYTVEAGLGENPLPLRDFGTIYADNVGLMTSALAMA